MKIKILFAFFSMMISLTSTTQSLSIGVAGIYGDDIRNAGAQVRGYYNLKGNRVCFGPEFSSFLKTTEIHNSEIIEKKLNELSFNLHYIFELNHRWAFYPLTGLNMSWENEVQIADQTEHSTTKLGANLGFGFHRKVGPWMFFAEYDHLFSALSQNSFLMGTFFTIRKKTKNNNEL